MTRKRYITLILILGTLTALGPFSIDMYLPGFPAIAKDLGTTVAEVSLSLSSFFIGISAGQFLYGPLMDRFGRKVPLYIGLCGYVIASTACAFATTIDALVILRFIQAICSCAAAVASVAMVRDLFPVQDNAKVFSLLMLVVGVSPMIAPTVGGYVTAGFGWEAVFLILAGMAAAILLAVYFGLPESSQPDPTYSLAPKQMIGKFMAVLKEPQFYTYAFSGAVSFAGLLAYVSGSPLVFMEIFQVNEKQYGWVFAFLSIGLIGASQVNSVMLRRFRSEQIIITALVCQLIIGGVLLAGTILGFLGLFSTIACIFLFLCCLGFTFPNASALSLAPFSKNAGSASALMGASQMGIGALATVVLSVFSNHSAVPMAGVMAASALLALLILWFGQKMIQAKGGLYEADPSAAGAIH
ncbi:multidrug effflux MFS transporter [Pontibacter sp. SGAir0037]|uniref:multidrug effflux MFS transporter n=1 Tax=Pontibacter sp. SGAir0037 TaxID=2571030 RepID=UPI0010CCB266|nr:multidrug effflux MFS transporter [Pontibacter sp. SGAir0037]QCR21816.1 Bcr/CflA family drug resistance efflux transporter [Pontibacter sp. SGAir0037]